MRLLATLLLAAALPLAAQAQSSSSSSSSSGSAPARGGSSGSAKTEQAPAGSLRTGSGGSASMNEGGSATMGGGSSTTLGAPGSGVAPGSSGRGAQQSRIPDDCVGTRCGTPSAPTGTGLGDRGTSQGPRTPYGPAESPVQGGPPFTAPTGRPLDLPEEGR